MMAGLTLTSAKIRIFENDCPCYFSFLRVHPAQFMRFLRAFWIFARRFRSQRKPDWKTTDAKALQAFLASSVGRKLIAHMEQHVIETQERACMTQQAFDCGWSCGFRGAYAFLLTFSAQPAELADPQDEVADDLEEILRA